MRDELALLRTTSKGFRQGGVPLGEGIRKHLAQLIAERRLETGAQLPSVTQLADIYQTSTATIQKVLRDLRHDGLIHGIRGKGIYVLDPEQRQETPGDVRVSSFDGVFGPDEWTVVRRQFNRRMPAYRIVENAAEADVVAMSGSDAPRLADRLEDVTELIERAYGRSADDLTPLRPLAVNGRHVMVPIVVDTLVMACNEDLFERAGVPLPSPGWTWPDCLQLARALTRPDADVYGFCPACVVPLFETLVWQHGGALYDSRGTTCLIDREHGESAARLMREFCACAPVNEQGESFWSRPDQLVFGTGRAAMMPANVWFPERVRRSGRPVRWKILPLPRGITPAGILLSRGFGIRRDTPLAKAARTLVLEAADLENWPNRISHRYLFHLHKDLEERDGLSPTFREGLAAGRHVLSDIAVPFRSLRHMQALRLLDPCLRGILNGADIPQSLSQTRHHIETMIADESQFLSWV